MYINPEVSNLRLKCQLVSFHISSAHFSLCLSFQFSFCFPFVFCPPYKLCCTGCCLFVSFSCFSVLVRLSTPRPHPRHQGATPVKGVRASSCYGCCKFYVLDWAATCGDGRRVHAIIDMLGLRHFAQVKWLRVLVRLWTSSHLVVSDSLCCR